MRKGGSVSATTYSRIAGAIFTLAALVHLYRLILPFPIQIGSQSVPNSASWAFVIIAGVLGFLGFRTRA